MVPTIDIIFKGNLDLALRCARTHSNFSTQLHRPRMDFVEMPACHVHICFILLQINRFEMLSRQHNKLVFVFAELSKLFCPSECHH